MVKRLILAVLIIILRVPISAYKVNSSSQSSAILGEPFGRADNKVEWIKKFAF